MSHLAHETLSRGSDRDHLLGAGRRRRPCRVERHLTPGVAGRRRGWRGHRSCAHVAQGVRGRHLRHRRQGSPDRFRAPRPRPVLGGHRRPGDPQSPPRPRRRPRPGDAREHRGARASRHRRLRPPSRSGHHGRRLVRARCPAALADAADVTQVRKRRTIDGRRVHGRAATLPHRDRRHHRGCRAPGRSREGPHEDAGPATGTAAQPHTVPTPPRVARSEGRRHHAPAHAHERLLPHRHCARDPTARS